jgi:hypothetical protein
MIINGKEYEYHEINVRVNGISINDFEIIKPIKPIEKYADFLLEFYLRRGKIFYFKNAHVIVKLELPLSASNFFKKGNKYNLLFSHELTNLEKTESKVEFTLTIPEIKL